MRNRPERPPPREVDEAMADIKGFSRSAAALLVVVGLAAGHARAQSGGSSSLWPKVGDVGLQRKLDHLGNGATVRVIVSVTGDPIAAAA